MSAPIFSSIAKIPDEGVWKEFGFIVWYHPLFAEVKILEELKFPVKKTP